MGTTPIGHSLIAASLIALVLIAVLTEPKNSAPAAAPTQSSSVDRVTNQTEGQQVTLVEISEGTEEVVELKTQVAALVERIESLEDQLKKQELPGSSAPKPVRVALSEAQTAVPKDPSELEARWVGQAADTNWEARVESQLADLLADTHNLGLGKIDLGAADCRGDLCKLNISSSMHPSMVQHLLTQFVGNTRVVVDGSLGRGGFMAFVQQRP